MLERTWFGLRTRETKSVEGVGGDEAAALWGIKLCRGSLEWFGELVATRLGGNVDNGVKYSRRSATRVEKVSRP